MKKLYILPALIAICFSIQAQQKGCISGSCENGKGKYIYDNGYIYEGEWLKGIRAGMGKLTDDQGNTYQGMFENDQFHGQGSYKWIDGSNYTGEWKNGVQDGYGIFFYANGDKYTGYFKSNKFHGKGKYTWADGGTQEGRYEEGQFKEAL